MQLSICYSGLEHKDTSCNLKFSMKNDKSTWQLENKILNKNKTDCITCEFLMSSDNAFCNLQ